MTFNMKLCVLGGVGFIGTNICLSAIARGHEVIAFDNLSRKHVTENLSTLENKRNFQFIHGDLRCAEDFDKLPKDIDCLINVAANPAIPMSIQNPVYDFNSNVVGHLHVLEYSRQHEKIPVIFASSNKVYTDSINDFPLVESETRYNYKDKHLAAGLNENVDVAGHNGYTHSPYGAGKLAGEKYTREYWKHYKIPMVINRMSCVYGIHQKGVEDQGWVDHFLRVKKYGGVINIYGSGKQVRDLVFAEDLVRLYLYEVENMHKVNGQTFNVGGGVGEGFNTSLLELVTLIDKEFSGPKLKLNFDKWRVSDQRVYLSDISKVKKVTGWRPTTKILSGLKKMWAAYP